MNTSFGLCQSKWENVGIELRPKVGYLLPHRSVMTHLLTGHSIGAELSLIKQTAGRKEWEQAYGKPRYGLSLFFSDFGNKEVLGQACGIHGFIELPIISHKSWSLNGKLTAGLGLVSKKFDLKTNPKNNAIGSHLNALVVIGMNINKHFNQSTLSLGVDMTHLSNGATVLPNLGINVPYLSLGYTYFLQPLIFKNESDEQPTPFVKNAVMTSALFSVKQIYPTGGRLYFVGSASAIYHHQFRRKAAIDLAFDVISNQSHLGESSIPVSQWDVVQLGIYAGYVLPVNQFDYILGMGYYLKNTINPNGPIYHRFGFRYHLTEKVMLNMSIKSHWGKADYFEYGIIYRWK